MSRSNWCHPARPSLAGCQKFDHQEGFVSLPKAPSSQPPGYVNRWRSRGSLTVGTVAARPLYKVAVSTHPSRPCVNTYREVDGNAGSDLGCKRWVSFRFLRWQVKNRRGGCCCLGPGCYATHEVIELCLRRNRISVWSMRPRPGGARIEPSRTHSESHSGRAHRLPRRL